MPGNADLQAEQSEPFTTHNLPTGPWADGTIPSRQIEGTLTRQAWRIEARGLTSLQIIRPLQAQLRDAGFDEIFACDTRDCGGFDFRFGIPVLAPPDMHVNLGDFRYLSATKTENGTDVSFDILVSQTVAAGFVQITRVGPATELATSAEAGPIRATMTNSDDTTLALALQANGRAVLNDLVFETGSAQLSNGAFDALEELSIYLQDNPDLRVALVGHTDSEGSLSGNIALSKRRAGSVLERLVREYGVARSQVAAEGMGYLSPIASNLTPHGREANRRVEIIVTSVGD